MEVWRVRAIAITDKSPIKIAYVVHSLEIGGLERCVARLVNGLDKAHFASVVISLTELGPAANWIHNSQTSVEGLHKRNGNDARLVFRLARLLRQNNVDIVHSHNWSTLIETVLARRIAGVPVHIHAERGTVLGDLDVTGLRRRLRAVLCRWALRRVDAAVAVSVATKSELASVCALRNDSIQVISNGVERPSVHELQLTRAKIRSYLGLPDNAIVVGAVGRLHPVKGLDTLIKAFHVILRDCPAAALVIVGDGPDFDRLHQEIERSALEERVHLVGASSSVGDWLAAMDIFVNSSISEGLSQAVLEAMSFGLPLVVTDVGDHAKVVSESKVGGACGLVVSPGTVGELAEALKSLVADTELRRRYGHHGLTRHQGHYNAVAMIRQYEELYRATLAPTTYQRKIRNLVSTKPPVIRQHLSEVNRL